MVKLKLAGKRGVLGKEKLRIAKDGFPSLIYDNNCYIEKDGKGIVKIKSEYYKVVKRK